VGLRVEFLLKTDSGYPNDTGVNKNFFLNIVSTSVLGEDYELFLFFGF